MRGVCGSTKDAKAERDQLAEELRNLYPGVAERWPSCWRALPPTIRRSSGSTRMVCRAIAHACCVPSWWRAASRVGCGIRSRWRGGSLMSCSYRHSSSGRDRTPAICGRGAGEDRPTVEFRVPAGHDSKPNEALAQKVTKNKKEILGSLALPSAGDAERGGATTHPFRSIAARGTAAEPHAVRSSARPIDGPRSLAFQIKPPVGGEIE
jgi:hypothetical protein